MGNEITGRQEGVSLVEIDDSLYVEQYSKWFKKESDIFLLSFLDVKHILTLNCTMNFN